MAKFDVDPLSLSVDASGRVKIDNAQLSSFVADNIANNSSDGTSDARNSGTCTGSNTGCNNTGNCSNTDNTDCMNSTCAIQLE